MARATTKSRPLVRPCDCGRPAMRYMTADGLKAAPYCVDCSKGNRLAS